jgi:hypothetical protein
MIQWGARSGEAEARNVFQSSRLCGAKSFVPAGQLFACSELRIGAHSSHLRRTGAEYAPVSWTFLQVHPVAATPATTVGVKS